MQGYKITEHENNKTEYSNLEYHIMFLFGKSSDRFLYYDQKGGKLDHYDICTTKLSCYCI
jgi:hypothetical protein